MSKQTDDIDGSQTEDDDSTQQNSPMTTPEELPARSQHGQSLNPQLSYRHRHSNKKSNRKAPKKRAPS